MGVKVQQAHEALVHDAGHRLPTSTALEPLLKYQLPGHSMEELISLRSTEDLEEFKARPKPAHVRSA